MKNRYSGVLHEINSEESTVSLESVTSYGTEGRRGNPDEEIPPADQVYEYIVFRGSDVKDLRIETPAPPKENKPPKMPDDPAILGVSRSSLELFTLSLLFETTLRPYMTKHFGCKHYLYRKAQTNPVLIFPLPSF